MFFLSFFLCLFQCFYPFNSTALAGDSKVIIKRPGGETITVTVPGDLALNTREGIKKFTASLECELLLMHSQESNPTEGRENTDIQIFEAVRRAATSKAIDSFQVHPYGVVLKGSRSGLRDWQDVRNRINSIFAGKFTTRWGSKNLTENDRGDGLAFIVFEDRGNQSILWSYGHTHFDHVGRDNMHYFEVVAPKETLLAALQTLKSSPEMASHFIKNVFGWKAFTPRSNLRSNDRDAQPDVFVNLNDLHTFDGANYTVQKVEK